MRKITLIILAGLLVLPVAAAARSVDETRAADPDGVVAIEVLSGQIRVIGWDRAEVNVTGAIDDEDYELEIEGSGKRVSISVEPVGHEMKMLDDDVELEIRVPSGGRLEADTLSASVTVEGINGAVTIESISGTVEVAGAVPRAEISTVSGTVNISSSAELESGSFESVSGTIRLRGMLSANGNFSFETVSGDIYLHLPPGTSAEFEIETFSGDIKNDFGPEAEKTSKFLPSKSLEFSMGGGGASVEVTSINGTVKLVQD